MARSDYIYLVRSGGLLSPDASPVAGFTVKRELRVWLEDKGADSLALLRVYRMRDGGQGAVVEMSVQEILEGK